MESERDESAVVAGFSRSGREDPAPPPPPPPGNHQANGGHRRGHRRRRRRSRGLVLAFGLMLTAAAYLVFSEALTSPAATPSAGWFFVAFVLWIVGLIRLYASNMN
uniref:Uncharacterized protein n=1 Tax=Oryza barthii TaxID=65489 RepID=A0A0D3GJT9_9ORYZ